MTTAQANDFFGPEVDLARMQRDRHAKLVAAMGEQGVDVLILVDPINVEYATGIALRNGGPATVAVVTASSEVFTFDAPADTQSAEFPGMPGYMLETWAKTAREIADALSHVEVGRAAIDSATLSCLRWLQQELKHPRKAHVTETGAPIAMAARMTKTPDEIECMRRSNRAMGYGLDAARDALHAGSTFEDGIQPMRDAFALLDPNGDCLTMGGGPASKNALLGLLFNASTDDGYNPGGEPSFVQRRISPRPHEAGDVLWPDSGLGYHGMESDYGRTWIIDAAPTSHQLDQFRRWVDVRDRTKELLRPGNTLADVVAAGRAAGGGKDPWLSHLFLAHGTGLVTEYPFAGVDLDSWLARSLTLPGELQSLRRDEMFELKAGMVIVVEPVIWDEPGQPGYRAEDTYLITDSGPEQLSDWSHAPFE